MHAHLVNVYSKFGGLHKILSDNGPDLKKISCKSKDWDRIDPVV